MRLDEPFAVGDEFLDVVDEMLGDAFIEDDGIQRTWSHRLTESFPLGRTTLGFINACQT